MHLTTRSLKKLSTAKIFDGAVSGFTIHTTQACETSNPKEVFGNHALTSSSSEQIKALQKHWSRPNAGPHCRVGGKHIHLSPHALRTIMEATESCMLRLKALDRENHLACFSSPPRSLAMSASR